MFKVFIKISTGAERNLMDSTLKVPFLLDVLNFLGKRIPRLSKKLDSQRNFPITDSWSWCAWPSSTWFLATLPAFFLGSTFLNYEPSLFYAWLHIPSTDPQPATTGSVPEPATAGLSPGAVVGVSITIFVVSFSAGALLATLITYCCCVRKKGKSSGHRHTTPSEGPQPAPVYDEVGTDKLKMKENFAYGPVDTLEMKQNPSYGPVRH